MPEYLAPGVFVEEVSFRSKSIEGVSTSTTAFVGPTLKGPRTGTPGIITSYPEFERIYGGFENLTFGDKAFTNYMALAVRAFFDNGGKRLYIARTYQPPVNGGIAKAEITSGQEFRSREPGSGYNGTVTVREKSKLVTDATRDKNPEGSLLSLTKGKEPGAASPARIQGAQEPFALIDEASMDVKVTDTDGDNQKKITFKGKNASVTGGVAADPKIASDGLELKVTIDKGQEQIIGIPDEEKTLQEVVAHINVNLRQGFARLDGAKLVIGSDTAGLKSSVAVEGPSELGLGDNPTADNSADTANNNVDDLSQVTISELAHLIVDESEAPVQVTASRDPDNHLVITTDAKGDGVTLTFPGSNTDVLEALGLTVDGAEPGQKGATQSYYIRKNDEWLDAESGELPNDNRDDTLEILTFNVEATDSSGVTVIYEELGFDKSHPRYIGKILPENPGSRSEVLQNPYFFFDDNSLTGLKLHQKMFDEGKDSKTLSLKDGSDGLKPVTVAFEEGLKLLEEIQDISIVAAPGSSDMSDTTHKAVQKQLHAHCQRMKYRVAVLDTRKGLDTRGARTERADLDSTYAALYYPWVTVANPLWRPGRDDVDREIDLPPSGFVTGIYARTDVNRGVWKAPANEVVWTALRFEREITTGQQEVLNPEGINCLRSFFGRGNRVWGGRTISSDPEWKYVNVRRYFIYLEASIDRSTQWAVFEPNGERLWSNITDTITSFLYNEWRSGALLGSTPEQAFFVRCDRSTMTQADLDNGRLVCEIGVAPLRPAEFVIFRIGQKTADA